MNKTSFITVVILIVIAILVIFKEKRNAQTNSTLKENSVILAFGDSLTYGFGVKKEFSYPAQLENKTGFKLINAGINGEISSEGLHRLPKLLLRYKPDLVILCHGGNDILQKIPSVTLRENLLSMIKLIKQSGSQILLVGVPNYNIFSFDTYNIYEDIADETAILYENEVLKYIALNREFKSDYVHPNEKGYEMMADAFIEILKMNRK